MTTRPVPTVAVTPPPIANSSRLREEIIRHFPQAKFNEQGRYLSEDELIGFAREADGLLIGRDPVSERVLQALPRLKIVAKYGVGLDTLDQPALNRRGIALGWTPGVNRRSVAELTLAFILGLMHNVFRTGFALKGGQWLKQGGHQLEHKTVGIVGCGNIGKEVIRLLQPFGCRLLVCDILDMTEYCQESGAVQKSFEILVEESDIVSLHVPLTDLTRNMIHTRIFALMRRGAYLVNTSRGEVVDTDALKQALRTGLIAGAALDVFATEPPEDKELLALPNLMVTPHIGGNAVEAVEAMGRAAIQHLIGFFSKG